MKIRIEIDPGLSENELFIRCPVLDEEVRLIEKTLSDIAKKENPFVFYKGDTEYYLPLHKILFFETEDGSVRAHTADNVFLTKYKLYELEGILPGNFMRVSKSTILNTDHIYSISRNISASSIVEFNASHKQVYVSRYYYKPLRFKLEEKRKFYEEKK